MTESGAYLYLLDVVTDVNQEDNSLTIKHIVTIKHTLEPGKDETCLKPKS